MRVLLVAKRFSGGGAASGALNLCESLKSVGLDVRPYEAHSKIKYSWLRGARLTERVIERLLYEAETHCLRLARPTFCLDKLERKEQPDIVQLCDVSANVIRFSDLAHLGCPVVHRMSDFWPYNGPRHYATNPETRASTALSLLLNTVLPGARMPDARVAPSQWLADGLVKSDPEKKIRVIRNAVAIPTKLQVRNPAADKISLGFISQTVLHPRKGFLSLPPLLEELSNRFSQTELHVYGGLRLQRLPRLKGVKVIAHGAFDRGDLARVYRSFDILLCPSYLDNSPNVVTEALAHGVPVIGQRGIGIDSYVNNRNGQLIDFHAPIDAASQQLIEACSTILSAYQDYSRSASEYARDHLSYETIGQAYLELYKELIEAYTKKPPEQRRNRSLIRLL